MPSIYFSVVILEVYPTVVVGVRMTTLLTVFIWIVLNFPHNSWLQITESWFCPILGAQMGGRNTVLLDAISCRIPLVSDIPTIIFGADVTHPENGEDTSPSIAAVWFPK
jgi:hypothetical protein